LIGSNRVFFSVHKNPRHRNPDPSNLSSLLIDPIKDLLSEFACMHNESVCCYNKCDSPVSSRQCQLNNSSRSFIRTDRRSTVTASSISSSTSGRRWPYTLIITIRYRAMTVPTK
ncbi:hypothetical protein ANCCAN_23023, partial [Ancylostoma caninum]